MKATGAVVWSAKSDDWIYQVINCEHSGLPMLMRSLAEKGAVMLLCIGSAGRR